MGLALRAITDDTARTLMDVGGYTYVHHLRALLVLLFAHSIYRIEGLDKSWIQDLLSWVKNLEHEGIADPYETEITEAVIAKALRPETTFHIYYGSVPETPFYIGGIPFGSDAAKAFMGLWKFVAHSDCDGGLSAGDVLDVALFFSFIEDKRGMLDEEDAKMVAKIAAFFNSAVAAQAPVLFV